MKQLSEAQVLFLQANSKVWAHLTDENEHTEVRVRIAHFFNVVSNGGATLLSAGYHNIQSEENRIGHLTKMMRNLRDALDKEMYAFIKEQFGENVFSQVHACL